MEKEPKEEEKKESETTLGSEEVKSPTEDSSPVSRGEVIEKEEKEEEKQDENISDKIDPQNIPAVEKEKEYPSVHHNVEKIVYQVLNQETKNIENKVKETLEASCVNEKRMDMILKKFQRVTSSYSSLQSEYSTFKKKTVDWQQMVKKISKEDLLKIKKLSQTLKEKEKDIQRLNEIVLENEKQNVKRELARAHHDGSDSSSSSSSSNEFLNLLNGIEDDTEEEEEEEEGKREEEIQKRILKRIELPSLNKIFWVILPKQQQQEEEEEEEKEKEEKEQEKEQEKEEKKILFIDENRIQNDRLKIKIPNTDEEELRNLKLKIKTLIQEYDEQAESLRSYKTRAHNALKKKTNEISKVKEDLSMIHDEYSLKINEYERQIEEFKGKLHKCKEEKETQQNLREEYERVENEKKELEGFLKKKSVENVNLIEENTQLLNRLDQMKEELNTAEEEFRNEIRNQKEKLQKRIDEKEKRIIEMMKKEQQQQQKNKKREQEEQETKNNKKNLLNEVLNMVDEEKKLKEQNQFEEIDLNSPKKEQSEKKNNFSSSSLDGIFELAEIQAKRDSELKEKEKTIANLKKKLKLYSNIDKEFNTLRATLKAKSEALDEVYKKNNIPNLEYLKNITVQLLLCDEKPVKKNLLKVVSKILKFDEKEYSQTYNKIVEGKYQKNSQSSSWSLFKFN